ncbi:MAG: cob(I)yrinic acid a,c-diamide adenosyltransferase [Candidatus Thermoplasmatota archaeon]
MVSEKGLIHVYTGEGKGKTTAAIGLGVRALGAGFKVYMIQFVKGSISSEINILKELKDFTVVQFGRDSFIKRNNIEQIDRDIAHRGLTHAKEVITSGLYKLVILDEINVAINKGLISLLDVIDLINSKPEHVELVLTGRDAPFEIIEHADIVSEILNIKHPYVKGMKNRIGIDL